MSSQKRFIVLVNKVPRGPLTIEEIRALLSEHIIRHNDTAFEVPVESADGTKKPAEWKLLWQFPDFDRRLEEEKENAKLTPEALAAKKKAMERRVPVTPEQVRERVILSVPKELLSIAPDELLPPRKSAPIVVDQKPDETSGYQGGGGFPKPLLFGGGLLVLALVGSFLFLPHGSNSNGDVAKESDPFKVENSNAPKARPAAPVRHVNKPLAKTNTQAGLHLPSRRPASERLPEPEAAKTDEDRGEVSLREGRDSAELREEAVPGRLKKRKAKARADPEEEENFDRDEDRDVGSSPFENESEEGERTDKGDPFDD